MQNVVPIITANYQPFRLVLRDEEDKWIPTLQQINSRDYDYVKLHRLSTIIDIGIAPYSMGVCFDGTLVLPALEQFQDRNVALKLFNKTLTELLAGGIYCEAVTPDDIGIGRLSHHGYVRIHSFGAGPSLIFHQAARSKHIGTLDVIGLLQPETIMITELHSAIETGHSLLRRLGDIPQEQVLYGTTFYVRKQWAESLLHVWTITERIVEIAWQKYVIPAFGKPTKERRSFLEDNRTWPISTKLEVLHQKSLLPSETADTLDEVRKARNGFTHRGTSPTHEIATKALQGCFHLASLCASNFSQLDLFDEVISLVINRCNPELIPQKIRYDESEISHWLPLPPLPGDKEWGDRPFEIIDELTLKPINEKGDN